MVEKYKFGQVGFGQVGFGQIDFGQLGFGQVGFGHVEFGQVGFGQVGFGQVSYSRFITRYSINDSIIVTTFDVSIDLDQRCLVRDVRVF